MKQRLVIGALVALLALITLIAAAPLLGVIVSASVASALHCQVDEGSAHPCLYAGHDLGPMLYDLGVLGWLMLVTLPVLFLALVVWLGIAIIWLSRRRAGSDRKARASSPE